MILDYEKISRIKNTLKFRSKGMSISEIAHQLRMNRNSVAKYLQILLMSGEVEAKTYGTLKVYSLSQRVPVSAMMGFSSDMIAMMDRDQRILQVNDRFLQVACVPRDALIGQRIVDTGIPFLTDLPIDALLKGSAEKRQKRSKKRCNTTEVTYTSVSSWSPRSLTMGKRVPPSSLRISPIASARRLRLRRAKRSTAA